MTDPAIAIATPFIAGFEGFRPAPYQDIVGVWTEGDGFTYLPDGSPVTANSPPMTQAQADAELAGWLETKTVPAVRGMIKVPVTDHMVAALASFAYNEGITALRTSTLLRDLNAGSVLAAEGQFDIWDMAGGRVVGGLLRRRRAELALFKTPDGVAPESVADQLMDRLD